MHAVTTGLAPLLITFQHNIARIRMLAIMTAREYRGHKTMSMYSYDSHSTTRSLRDHHPRLIQMLGGDNYGWECECGARGISSSIEWAKSDVERHRQQNRVPLPCLVNALN